MCGREPNFELTEEEKDELRQYTWEDFLEMTRNNINNKSKIFSFWVNSILYAEAKLNTIQTFTIGWYFAGCSWINDIVSFFWRILH